MPFQLPPNAMMSAQGPQPMSLVDKLRSLMGGPTDIQLPNESGMVDPNLPASPLEQLKKAFGAANKFATEQDPIQGLRKAGGY